MGRSPRDLPRPSVPRRVSGVKLAVFFVAVLPVALAGCQTGSTGTTAFGPRGERNQPPETPFAGASPRHLSASEIRRTSVNDLYQVVERLRPLWLRYSALRSRQSDTEVIVVWNGSYFGPLSSLRRLTPEHVRSMRYVDGATASAHYPYTGGIRPHILGGIIIDMGAVTEEDDPPADSEEQARR